MAYSHFPVACTAVKTQGHFEALLEVGSMVQRCNLLVFRGFHEVLRQECCWVNVVAEILCLPANLSDPLSPVHSLPQDAQSSMQ